MKPSKTLRDEFRKTAFLQGFRKQNDIAEALDVSASYVSAVLSGQRNATPNLVDKFVVWLNVPEAKARRWHRLGALESGWKF